MLEFAMLIIAVAFVSVARSLARIARTLRHFKVQAVIPVYETDDDPEPTEQPKRDNVVRGRF